MHITKTAITIPANNPKVHIGYSPLVKYPINKNRDKRNRNATDIMSNAVNLESHSLLTENENKAKFEIAINMSSGVGMLFL